MPKKYIRRRVQKRKSKVPDKIKKYVHKVVDAQPEMKQWALSQTNQAGISQTVGTKFVFNLMGAVVGQQGAGDYQRIGSKIKVHEIMYRATIQVAPLQGQAALLRVRCIILIDKKADGVAIPGAELMYDTGTNQAISSPFNNKFKHEYTILSDRVYDLSAPMFSASIAGGTTYTNYVGNSTKSVVYKHKFKHPLTLSYYTNATALDITAVEGPAIYAIWFAESAGINVVDAYTNMIFTDA